MCAASNIGSSVNQSANEASRRCRLARLFLSPVASNMETGGRGRPITSPAWRGPAGLRSIDPSMRRGRHASPAPRRPLATALDAGRPASSGRRSRGAQRAKPRAEAKGARTKGLEGFKLDRAPPRDGSPMEESRAGREGAVRGTHTPRLACRRLPRCPGRLSLTVWERGPMAAPWRPCGPNRLRLAHGGPPAACTKDGSAFSTVFG